MTGVLFALVTMSYPIMVYFLFDRFEPGWIMVPVTVLAAGRAWITRDALWLAIAVGAGLLGLASHFRGDLLPLQLYPVLVNGILLCAFAISLASPRSAVERLARLRDPDLPAAAVAYTRTVTQVWCGFFVLNGSAALATALWASPEVWTVYNGFVAYVLMGMLFGCEWLIRKRVRARIASDAEAGVING